MPESLPLLAGERARLTALRLPTGLLRTAVVLAVLMPIATSMTAGTDAPVTAPLVESQTWLVASLAQSLALSAIVLVFLAPGAGVVVAAGAMAIAGQLPATHVGVPAAWTTSGIVLGLIAVVHALLTVRRRLLTRVAWREGGQSSLAPDLADGLSDRLHGIGRSRLAAGVLLLVGSAALVAWGVRDADSAADFRARATTVEVTVVAATDGDTSALVSLDGTTHPLPVMNAERHPGDRVLVRFDEGTGRLEAVDDAFDPTLILIPATAAAVVGSALIIRRRRLRARMHELLTRPQPAVRALATAAPRARGALLLAHDDVTRPAAVAPRLIMIGGDEEPAGPWPEVDDDPAWDGPERSGWYEDEAEAEAEETVLLSDLSDAELLEIAESLDQPAIPEPPPGPTEGPAGWKLTPVTVIGALESGWPVVLQEGSRAYVTMRPVRSSAWRALRPRSRPALERTSLLRALNEGLADGIIGLGLVAGRWVPWLGLPFAWLLSSWLIGITGPAPRLVIPGLVLVTIAWSVAVVGHSAVELRPKYLQFRGVVIDTLVPWARLTGVSSTEKAVVVRFADRSERGSVFFLADTPNGRRLTRDKASAAELAGRLERAWSLGGETARRVHRRPSAPTVVAACWVLALFLPALASLRGSG